MILRSFLSFNFCYFDYYIHLFSVISQDQPPFVLFQNFNFSARVCNKVGMISKALDVMHTLHRITAVEHSYSSFILHVQEFEEVQKSRTTPNS